MAAGFPVTKSDQGITCIIYTANAGGNYPIHGAYYDGDGSWFPTAWRANGKMFEFKETALDITKAITDGLFTQKEVQVQQKEEENKGAVQVEAGSKLCGTAIQERTES